MGAGKSSPGAGVRLKGREGTLFGTAKKKFGCAARQIEWGAVRVDGESSMATPSASCLRGASGPNRRPLRNMPARCPERDRLLEWLALALWLRSPSKGRPSLWASGGRRVGLAVLAPSGAAASSKPLGAFPEASRVAPFLTGGRRRGASSYLPLMSSGAWLRR
jgi:hypothetical protein